MNRIALIAVLGALSASAAYAQQIQWVDPAVPKGMLESKGGPSGTLADPAVPQLVQDPTRGHNDADARQCLQLTTNDQIHRCAEKYRSPASRAKLVKTAQPAGKSKAGETVQPAETPKAAESAKTTPKAKAADTPKPAAPAKSTEPVKAASPAKSPASPKPADAAKTDK